MRTTIGNNEPSCPFYLVVLETDSGGDHNHKHFRNQLDICGLFFLGNMDKINVICGYYGISFLSTADRDMDLLNIGLPGLLLKFNVHVGN